ncbi:VOC family protein [Paraburkholderia sp. Ac-20340]|uniref:VOC family protein n=1 Tax=Paraburkholderia sp. Ac-20340 TaxID=2703888 RepID=UPI00197F0F60|nr:VOC family protein [Paraburkholderia sp. Ac-20340]MBN3856458.1 VOC family protein [Paraburkholderia sp. Ac-20340]
MNPPTARIESLNAITLTVSDIARSVRFYEALGFTHKAGAAIAGFASFELGQGAAACYLNLLEGQHGKVDGWGRAIFYVSDVDVFHAQVCAAGLTPEFAPQDAPWGERYFHLLDPDGHELSFARPLGQAIHGK